jgi:RNA polymerase sigma-70 factor (ECF subfamily)
MEPAEGPLDFSSIYARHAPLVRRLLTRRGVRANDLDDVQQEAFVTIHRLLPSFEGRASVETWLHSVTWRVAASYHRRARSLPQVGGDASDRSIADQVAPAARDGLHASLALLDEENRDVIALHDIGGLSISQLSELTGNARATIRQRLERGRLALGRRMWRALGERDEDAWLERLSPRLAQRLHGAPLPLVRGVVVSGETAISIIDDLAIVVWRGASTAETMATLIELLIPLTEASPNGLRYLSVVERTSTPPDREARQMMAWGAGRLGPKVRAAAWAVEDSTMMSIVAPVVNACFFLGGVPINMRFFDGVPPAASWLTQYGSLGPAQITAHVESMRHRLGRPRPS